MKNSDELREEAVHMLQVATACQEADARLVVLSIAAYIGQFNNEIVLEKGPAWRAYQAEISS